jgi:hypothetical protein
LDVANKRRVSAWSPSHSQEQVKSRQSG